MPTEYNKKTDRGMARRDIYEHAAEVTRRQKSLRNAASSYNLNYISLYREESTDIAVIPRNVYSGFSATGVWLVNTEIFQDGDNLPSQMLDQPSMSSATENFGPFNSNLVLNLPATPPRASEISFETEDVSNSAENPDNNSPDLAMSEQNLLS
ncbi:unnamed protein product [Euphydryas editha]|uniref:Uncharacterized protein n=1 Tax=Euphydryas editha TaxID=104508 RepID=A0AAU9UU92_EUPED|nr:unnamed protein product [Euphydryas editha]